MKNPIVSLALGFQALRRVAERQRSPLCGALGVRAELYTHQVANVQRILAAEEIRHLLADEVGLGKTIQALMVVNALRLTQPNVRILVLVPDHLVPQWRDEILARAHIAPIEQAPDSDSVRRLRLAWPKTITTSEITAANYDLIIVDELHQLTTAFQDRVVQEAARFKHLLILTATPDFRSPLRHVQLFAALEPDRTGAARRRVAQTQEGCEAQLSEEPRLTSWPQWALNQVIDLLLARDERVGELLGADASLGDWRAHGGPPPESRAAERAALAHCAYRRVIRTRRNDYEGVLPRRVHHPIVVEPTFGEAERQRLMWEYFGHLAGLTREFDHVKLAKRVILSAPSLRQRVAFLRRKGHEREGLLERVTPLLADEHGDARLDALTDLLAAVWRQNPKERVLVAAQDNLTVDYLYKAIPARLPMIGTHLARVDLVAARVRQGMDVEAVEDLAGYGNETSENLDAFQRGEAQVLFAPAAAQVGLNLQCARVIVLYSVPWSPEEVEQWIGRLDRLGNTAVRGRDGVILPVDVYTIVQRGLVDEKVVGVLQRFRAFEQNINLDGEHLQEIADSIEAAALKPQSLDWSSLERAADKMSREDSGQELVSTLRAHLPWGPERARRLQVFIEGLPPVAGGLGVPAEDTGPASWDQAVDSWMTLLAKAEEYQVRFGQRDAGDSRSRFASLWYTYGEHLPFKGGRAVRSQVWLGSSSGVDNPQRDRHPRNALAFFSNRRRLKQPPRREVHMSLGKESCPRPLHFLNHGDPLHEDLVSGWLGVASASPERIEARLSRDHPAVVAGGEAVYIVRAAMLDSAQCVPPADDQGVLAPLGRAVSMLSPAKLMSVLSPVVERLRASLEADARWLRSELPGELMLTAWRREAGGWRPVEPTILEALLNPYHSSPERHPVSREWRTSGPVEAGLREGFEALAADQRRSAQSRWSSRLPSLEDAIGGRAYTVTVNGLDSSAVRSAAVEEAEGKLQLALASGVRLSIGRAEAQHREAVDLAAADQAASGARVDWLRGALERARSPEPIPRMEVALRLLPER